MRVSGLMGLVEEDVMDNIFKFKLGEKVKVQVFNFITTGIVVERQLFENNRNTSIRYQVQFDNRACDIVEPWEYDLEYVQTLPLGKIEK